MKADSSNWIQESEEILKKLAKVFIGEDTYLPWVRYFDVLQKVYGKVKNIHEFQDCLHDLIIKPFLLSQGKLDWRIVRKMLTIQQVLKDEVKDLIQTYPLIEEIRLKLEEALDYLVWIGSKDDPERESLAREIIEGLLSLLANPSKNDLVKNAIICGRFDKKIFGLENTIIIGEDGGLFALLNKVDEEKETFIKKIVGKYYLQDKISLCNGVKKVIIGKGGFGKVRFALSLIEGVSKPNDLMCIKKTKSFEQIPLTDVFIKNEIIIENTLRDYFAHDLTKFLPSAKIVDMAINNHEILELDRHKKGYLMMEIIPQNTGAKVFSVSENQKWEYQKPYLLDVLEGVNTLLEMGVAMTDLKPENTLYDKNLRKGFIIDLGGTVRPKEKSELSQFSLKKYSIQYTERFAAPEIKEKRSDKSKPIDLLKAIAYSCGKLIEYTTKFTDYPEVDKINTIWKSLILEEPTERWSVKEAIKEIEKLGAKNFKELSSHYISKIKTGIMNNPASISLNHDILQTRELLIPLEVTHLNPNKYPAFETSNIDVKVNEFFQSQDKQVFLLLGEAGSGKSTVLQLKFIEAVELWTNNKPFPIYINLARGINFDESLMKLNQEIETDISIESLKHKEVHLFVDSFDEGIYPSNEEKAALILNYLEKLGNNAHTKIFLTCRSGYPFRDGWLAKKFEKCYIIPLIFKNAQELKKRLNNYLEATNHTSIKIDWQEEIKKSQINISTGFLFHLLMKTLPSLLDTKQTIPLDLNKCSNTNNEFREYIEENGYDEKSEITIERIYQQFDSSFQDQAFNNFTINQQSLMKDIRSNKNLLRDFGQRIATLLHINKQHRINFRDLEADSFFKPILRYKQNRSFKTQLASYILKILPLKVEVNIIEKEGKLTEEITIEFIHGIIKNYFLADVIFSDLNNLKILSSYNLNEDTELIKYLAEIIENNPKYQEPFLQAVLRTREDKSTAMVTCAANAMTILVASKYSFSAIDLSNISICGADLSSGIFHRTNFTNSNLSNVILKNANLSEAIFRSTNMENIDFGIFPDLRRYSGFVTSVAFSPDGKTLATGSEDETAKIWDVASCQVLQTLDGHSKKVTSIAFSPDGKTLATGSDDETAKIWDVASCQVLQTLSGHSESVRSVAFSPDGKIIATGSWDQSVKVWHVYSGQELHTLFGHSNHVTSVAFSHDGKTLATGSEDKTAKIWDVYSGKVLQTSHGHSTGVASVAFSPDGKRLTTVSQDETAKIWDVVSGKELRTLSGHPDEILSVAYSQDGKILATGSYDKTVKIWDAYSGKEFGKLEKENSPYLPLPFQREMYFSLMRNLQASFLTVGGMILESPVNLSKSNEVVLKQYNCEFHSYSSKKLPIDK